MAGVKVALVSPDLDAMVRNLYTLEDDLADNAEQYWEQVTEVFFANTQQAVHIISGDLKASGKSDTSRDGSSVVGQVSYGGTMGTEGQVDYAVYEFRRGGEHDALAVGWQKTERTFDNTMGDIWTRTVEEWD